MAKGILLAAEDRNLVRAPTSPATSSNTNQVRLCFCLSAFAEVRGGGSETTYRFPQAHPKLKWQQNPRALTPTSPGRRRQAAPAQLCQPLASPEYSEVRKWRAPAVSRGISVLAPIFGAWKGVWDVFGALECACAGGGERGSRGVERREGTVSWLHAVPSPAPQVLVENPRNQPIVLGSRTEVCDNIWVVYG